MVSELEAVVEVCAAANDHGDSGPEDYGFHTKNKGLEKDDEAADYEHYT